MLVPVVADMVEVDLVIRMETKGAKSLPATGDDLPIVLHVQAAGI
jgi:hypothetical protein